MITIPFRKQYDKLVKAYLKDEVKPDLCTACFVGNLLNNDHNWKSLTERFMLGGMYNTSYSSVLHCKNAEVRKEALASIRVHGKDMYTPKDIAQLEKVFMTKIGEATPATLGYEGILFDAFEAGLLKLREIHESKGEVIEDYTFTKRVLEPVSI